MKYAFLLPGIDGCEEFHRHRFFVCVNCGSQWDVLQGEVNIKRDYKGMLTINGIEYNSLGEYLRARGECAQDPLDKGDEVEF